MTPRARSAVHPSATWSECLTLIRELDNLGRGGASLDMLASAFHIKNWKTKTFQSKITSSKLFGLIDIKSGAATLTADGHELLHPTTPDLRPLELELFSRPELYRRLISAYDGKPIPRRELFENILVANYGISDIAKKRAAAAFIASAEELGIIVNGIMSYETALNSSTEMNTPYRAIQDESDPVETKDPQASNIPAAHDEPSTYPHFFVMTIPVSTGTSCIEIKIPDDATASDLEMAKEIIGVYCKRLDS